MYIRYLQQLLPYNIFFRRHSLNASSRRIFTNTERYTYLLFMEKHFIYRDKLREKDGTIIR